MSRVLSAYWTILALAALAACSSGERTAATDSTASSGPQATSSAAMGTASVSGAQIAVAHAGSPGEWQMPAGDYASSRYSQLASITPQNAANLKVAWAFSTGVLHLRGRGKDGPFNRRYQFTDTWQLRNGRWQIIAAQDYLIPK